MTDKTHNCTNCNKELTYTNSGSWYNARRRLRERGSLLCKTCQDEQAKIVNKGNPKITGRPKGSKNSYKVKRGKDNWKNLKWDKFETRMLQVARRNGYDTYEEYRDSLPEWKRYKIDVWRVTNQQPLHLLENFDKRGVNGQPGAYTLDHIISVKKGFMTGTAPEVIGHIDNLQMLPWEENITKGWK